MNLYDSKSFFYADNKRTTMFPSLKKVQKPKSLRRNELLGLSMDQNKYRMTSNQMIKGILKQNDSQISKLRSTFMKQSLQESTKRKIGQYQIVKEIGKGGFAQVYQVNDQKGKKFALKEYNLQNSHQCFHNQANFGDFFFEKGTVRKEHEKNEGSKNLIKFVEKFRIGKYGYIVQELAQQNFSKLISDIQGVFHNTQRVYEVRFKDFYRQLAGNGQLKAILIDLCKVVGMINKQGFIHCDLKLQNLMLQFDGEKPTIKLIDFGSTFEREYGLPKITITPEYMPPQLLMMLENGSSQHELLKKVDVWSIGCILLQIVTGVPLWFRYKCKVQIKGRSVVQMGFFALTGRDYTKIIKKQRQIIENMGRIPFTFKEFDRFRPILKRLLVLSPHKRISLEQCIQLLQQLQ